MKEEQDAFLSERLQEILTEEEYQAYEESLPEAAAGKLSVPGFLREPPAERQAGSR
jgi:hypothetical protein